MMLEDVKRRKGYHEGERERERKSLQLTSIHNIPFIGLTRAWP